MWFSLFWSVSVFGAKSRDRRVVCSAPPSSCCSCRTVGVVIFFSGVSQKQQQLALRRAAMSKKCELKLNLKRGVEFRSPVLRLQEEGNLSVGGDVTLPLLSFFESFIS